MGNIPKITAYLNQPPTIFAPPEMSRPMPSIVPHEARLQRTTAAKISFMFILLFRPPDFGLKSKPVTING